jgi:hypothetical protein
MDPNDTCPCSINDGPRCEKGDAAPGLLHMIVAALRRKDGKPMPFRIGKTVCAISYMGLLCDIGEVFNNDEVIEIFSLLVKCELGSLKHQPEVPIERLHLKKSIPVYRILKKRMMTFTNDQCNKVVSCLILASVSRYQRYWRKQCRIFIEECTERVNIPTATVSKASTTA